MHLKKQLSKILRLYPKLSSKDEIDGLYRLLYDLAHDLDNSPDFITRITEKNFGIQWDEFNSGEALLDDSWFKDNVVRILTEEEIQISEDWFKGKWILDAGCGQGRWSYGLAKMGANVVAVDVNESAIRQTQTALSSLNVEKEFYQCPLEDIDQLFGERKFDLVFSWGVIHHCKSFTRSFNNLTSLVKDTGILYIYLYGRESIPYDEDIELFKIRLHYNLLPGKKEKEEFLLKLAKGNRNKVHNYHDIYAPLINRRLEYDNVREMLADRGFSQIFRTIEHTELFIRGIKEKNPGDFPRNYILPKAKKPFWFERYN